MVIYYGNRANKTKIGFANSLSECCKVMNEYLKKNNLKSSPYRRYFESDGLIQVDYGSWSSFFYIGGISVSKFLDLKE